jgi:hypothetical protein
LIVSNGGMLRALEQDAEPLKTNFSLDAAGLQWRACSAQRALYLRATARAGNAIYYQHTWINGEKIEATVVKIVPK